MNPEQQQISIAEYLGWKEIKPYNDGCYGYAPKPDGGHDPFNTRVPDYLNDFNAINEAEQSIDNYDEFGRQLSKIALRDSNDGTGLYERLVRVKCAQRAEAFLRLASRWLGE